MRTRISFVSLLSMLALSMCIGANALGAAGTLGSEPVQLPKGVIVMWSGSVAEIPKGWSLCDGTKGTPDLRDRFVFGAGSTQQTGIKGGSYNHGHNLADHSHRNTLPRSKVDTVRIPYGRDGDYGSFRYKMHRQRYYSSSSGTFNSAAAAPQIQSNRHLPPYFKIAFIMKN